MLQNFHNTFQKFFHTRALTALFKKADVLESEEPSGQIGQITRNLYPGGYGAFAHHSGPEGSTRTSKQSINLNTMWGSRNHSKNSMKISSPKPFDGD
jgi:hypothetical protein